MSEQIGEFSLQHAGSTYARTPEGELANYANFTGTASGYGAVFGTLKFQNPLSEIGAKSGTCTWSGQAFLDDGTSAGGFGEGTWEQIGDQNKWAVRMNVEVSDGSSHRSEGEIDLATLVRWQDVFCGLTHWEFELYLSVIHNQPAKPAN